MLKLERINKSFDLNITLRKRDRFFNRLMLQGLAIGLGVHLVGFFLFPIVSAKFTGSHRMMPPVAVVTDIHEGTIAANSEEEELSPRFLQPPKTPRLILPPLPELPPLATYSPDPLFAQSTFDPVMQLLDPPQKQDQPVSIHLSGPLSAHRYAPLKLQLPPPQGTSRVVFHVILENRTGEIFWYEPKEWQGNEKLLRLAEEIVQNMRFEKRRDLFVTDGEIEIVFSS